MMQKGFLNTLRVSILEMDEYGRDAGIVRGAWRKRPACWNERDARSTFKNSSWWRLDEGDKYG